MANTIPFQAQMRDTTHNNRALRRANMTPGVMYGRVRQPVALQFDTAAATRLVREAGSSHLITVTIDGVEATQDAFIRDVQRDPVTGRVLHIDLYAVSADQVVTSLVPLVAEGDAPASAEGLVVTQLLEEIEVECLPRDMPAMLVVDMTTLVDLDSVIRVSDLAVPAGVTLLIDDDTIVAHVSPPEVEEVEEEAEEDEDQPVAKATPGPAGKPEAHK